MRALVIGAAGFVGAYLLRHLQQELGYTVAATKLPGEQLREAWADRSENKRGGPDAVVDWYDLDILNPEAVLELFRKVRPDHIFHLAAQSSVAAAWKYPGLTVDVNIHGTVNVLEALRELEWKPRLLLIGSGEEYGRPGPREIPVREEHRLEPGNVYAATKACQNMLGRIYAEAYGLEVVMVRAFNHIGPNQEPLFVAADFCRQAALIEAGRKEAVIRVGNLDVRRDFTDVRDVVRAYAMLAERGAAGETYNVGSGRAVRIADMLQMIVKRAEADIRIEQDTERMRPADVPVMAADISKLQKVTGWEPRICLEQTIAETLDYWRGRVLAEKFFDG